MQVLLDKTLNIISIQENGLLIHSTCLYPFYSPDNNKVAFWVQDYDYQNDVYLSSYQLYCKNLKTNKLIKINTGNGTCPLPPNVSPNEKIYNASFSPDSNSILFLTTSTNLILGDTSLSSQTPSYNRWYVYNFISETFVRVSSTALLYGNSYDGNEAIWYDNNNVVFTTLSNNLVTGLNTNEHYEVFLKNITTGNITHISRRESSNISPFFTYSCINISCCNDKISFYSYELGYVIKKISDTTLTRVQELPGISTYGIISTDTMSWSSDGTKLLFRISSGTSIIPDTNGVDDDFVYDFNTDAIIPLNENSLETIFGNGYSRHASFSPDGTMVAFISNSYNIDPTSTNPIDNLYCKNLSTRILTRISKSTTNGNILSNILGYTWLTDNTLAFTSYSNDLVAGDNNNIVDWFVRNIANSTTIRINYNTNMQLFSEMNNYNGLLRKEMFNSLGTRLVFTTKLKTLNPNFYTPSYDEYDIFEKIFIEETVAYPISVDYSVEANDSINAYVDNGKLLAYTVNDSITGTPTYSIVGSTYVERVNSINHKNDNTNIRWMSFKYPNLPYDCPVPAKIGVGFFNSSNTLLDDIIDIKQNNVTTAQNSVYGAVALISVRPQNDIVLTTAGDDQQRICDPIVYLQATVNGNLSGHTFLWELISGEPVTLIQNSQTQAHYVVDSTTRDRVFRFWIDKGKYNQQFNDVKIYATPTDYFSLISGGPSNLEVNTDFDPVLKVSLYSLSSASPDNLNNIHGYATYDKYSVAISWALPDLYLLADNNKIILYKSSFVGTTLEANTNGVWYTLISVGINDSRFYAGIPIGTPIRIGSIYNFKGKEQIYYSDVVYSSSLITGYDRVYQGILAESSLTYTTAKTIYDMTAINVNDEITQSALLQTNLDVTRNNTIYDMTNIILDDEITNIQFSTSNLSYTIYRYNGAVIGG